MADLIEIVICFFLDGSLFSMGAEWHRTGRETAGISAAGQGGSIVYVKFCAALQHSGRAVMDIARHRK